MSMHLLTVKYLTKSDPPFVADTEPKPEEQKGDLEP